MVQTSVTRLQELMPLSCLLTVKVSLWQCLKQWGVSLPVLVTEATPIPEIERNKCGWRVPADVDSLAKALVELAQCTADDLRTMGLNGRRVVLEYYTWQRVAGMTRELYAWLNGHAAKPSFVVED